MTTAILRAARVLLREGPAGIIGRLRHPAAPPAPAPPSLDPRAEVLGASAMQHLVQRVLSDFGDPDARGTSRLIIGDATGCAAPLRTGDIVIPTAETPTAWLTAAWDSAALVLEFDPDRIAALQRRPGGRPHWLAIPPPPAAAAGEAAWHAYAEAAAFYLKRALIFTGCARASIVNYGPAMAPPSPAPGALCAPEVRLALTLPETPERAAAFRATGPTGLGLIEGLRRAPGWKGAGSTYRELARAARARGAPAMLVCQDDALPAVDFARRYDIALRYWQRSGAAMFAGLVTDVDGITVRDVVRHEGMTFLHLDRSVGLVFNLFGPAMIERLAQWDADTGDVRDTIDRFVSRTPGVEVVTCLPYLVSHREDQRSTIWGFDNGRYSSMIRASERRLARIAGVTLPRG